LIDDGMCAIFSYNNTKFPEVPMEKELGFLPSADQHAKDFLHQAKTRPKELEGIITICNTY
jgi:hypothetical protein